MYIDIALIKFQDGIKEHKANLRLYTSHIALTNLVQTQLIKINFNVY